MSESPLFRPLEVAGLTLKNRLVMPPMGSGLADADGFVTDRLRDYYVRRAAGGIGTITLEATLITPDTAGVGPETRVHGPEFVPGLASVAAAVKEHDVTIGLQLWHPGRQTKLGRPVAPSPIPLAKRGEVPRELTMDEIDEIHARYAAGARYAREAGFDFVEVHGAHCYLPCEFLSPVANVRDDEYGGSLENRARFAIRTVQAIRETLGPDFPIFYRISGEEGYEGGFTIDDTVEVARWLVAAGVDCVSVSAGSWYALHYTIPPMFMDRGCLVPYARRIKREIDVPVMAAGLLDDPALAESVLDDGDADLIGIGRGLIADADWPAKVRERRFDDVRPCIACNACVDRVSDGGEARCAVNPEVGREGTWRIEAAERPRRVMVVGGGPAGMEAARVAGLRGHNVSLYEREPDLGGKLTVAAAAPSKSSVASFRDYSVRAIRALGVDVHTATEVTPDLLADVDPDVVIVATGAETRIFPIPGIDLPHVVDALDVLLGRVELAPSERVAILGGGATGVETAEMLLGTVAEIYLLEMLPRIGQGIEQITRKYLFGMLVAGGVQIMTSTRVTEILGDAVRFERPDGSAGEMEADRVVLAMGWRSRGPDLADRIGGEYEVVVVGDAASPRDFVAAVNSGADAGLAI